MGFDIYLIDCEIGDFMPTDKTKVLRINVTSLPEIGLFREIFGSGKFFEWTGKNKLSNVDETYSIEYIEFDFENMDIDSVYEKVHMYEAGKLFKCNIHDIQRISQSILFIENMKRQGYKISIPDQVDKNNFGLEICNIMNMGINMNHEGTHPKLFIW